MRIGCEVKIAQHIHFPSDDQQFNERKVELG